MKVYPTEIEQKLEVDQIRDLIKGECQTEAATGYVDRAIPQIRFEKLSVILAQTAECIRIFSNPETKPSHQFEDIVPMLSHISSYGSYLSGEDFLILKTGLTTLNSWLLFLKKNKEVYSNLFQLTLGYSIDSELIKQIDYTIDEKGEVRSTASSELIHIRSSLVKAEQKVRKSIRSILEKSKKDKYSEEDGEVTIREGRLVIPVKAEYKRQIAGFVHDESSTGQTVFMEPSEVLSLNNEVRELYYQERREIQRILTQLSDSVRNQLDDLKNGAKFMVLLDFITAKAKFALKYHCVIPSLTKTPGIKLEQAYHPLLKKVNDEHRKLTVPLSIQLDHQHQRLIVISGPNAGGKSVAMKTIGILQYMVQCGFPVSVDESSEFGVFNQIFIDIGDAQSLENDLSTYSSRLKGMKFFAEMADKRTLVLMDEFGSGTEPQFGGALAEAILNRLATLKCYGVVTTHYANIKKFAEHTPGMVNAAMRYDTDQLEPLFQLDVGRPGSSFALEIAKKTGIQADLLDYAKKHIGSSHVDFEKLLTQVENDKVKIQHQLKKIDKEEAELKKLRADYESLKVMLESERKAMLRQAKDEAKRILAEANKTVEKTIREIKESQANKEKTKQAREVMDSLKSKLELEQHQVVHEKKSLPSHQLKEGDWVRLDGQEGLGQITHIQRKQAQVSFGSLKSFVSLSRLEKVSNSVARKEIRKKVSGININEKMSHFSHELDVRGKRAEETLPLVDEWIDQAVLLGVNELRIVHGKGHGVLRNLIRNEFKHHPNIKGFTDEHEDRGGAGITIVSLK